METRHRERSSCYRVARVPNAKAPHKTKRRPDLRALFGFKSYDSYYLNCKLLSTFSPSFST